MNVLKGYKETEIGLLPTDWELKSVGTHCIVKARIGWQGLRSDEYLSSGEYGLITSTDLVDGRVNWGSCCFVSKSRYLQDSNIIVREDDILVSKDGTIGKVGIVHNIPFPSTLNSGVFVIRPKFDDVYKKYLAFAFKSVYFQDFINRLTAGSTIVHLYQKDIVNFKFPVPPPVEQRAIAEALSDVDGLIGALDKKIVKKRLLKQGAMQQLLTGKKRLPGFTDKWVEKKLSDFGYMVRGVSYRPEQCSIVPKEKFIRLFRSNNVQNEAIVYSDYVYVYKSCISEKQKIIKNDILICTANGSKQLVGKSALIDKEGDFSFGAFMGVFRCYNRALASFVISLLHSDAYKKQIEDILTGSAINNLNASTVESISFFVPSLLKEQQAIATILSDMDKEIADLEAQRDKYRLLKSGMMQKLLTGQIRLRTK